MSWYEVESKIKIDDYDAVKSSVGKIAKFVKRELKKDEYFAPSSGRYPHKAFRVRREAGRFIINFKKWPKELWDRNIVIKEEFEFSINSPEELSNFISLFSDFGFSEWVKKSKSSEIYSYNKDKRLTIELNKVSKLGNWMEIEYLCNKDKIPRAKRVIREVIKKIDGLGKIDNTGYTKMLYNINKKEKNR